MTQIQSGQPIGLPFLCLSPELQAIRPEPVYNAHIFVIGKILLNTLRDFLPDLLGIDQRFGCCIDQGIYVFKPPGQVFSRCFSPTNRMPTANSTR